MSDEPEILLEKLRVALSLVETLTKENDAYKENFEQLKNAHDRLQEQYDSLGRECELTSKDKASIETQTAEQLAYFKAQLDNKSREVDSLKGRIPLAKEMELAHLKAVHQMQEDNERRWKQMVTETEKFRSLYYNLRRNYEVAMTDIERERAQMTGKLKELEEDYQVEMNALEEKMMELRQRLEAAGDTKHIRELQRVNTEVQLKIQALLSEVEELR
ncbi:hypothetical protein BC832DRAFT_91098 [Gaertneriomyces semiglobifer]|nr:hypothetical protein BC832DRAFT_91098 [Gaertneriomyces semiglobifer]